MKKSRAILLKTKKSNIKNRQALLALIFAALIGNIVWMNTKAHDIRPAYLEINYKSEGQSMNVLWKVSLFGNPNVDLMPIISNVLLEPENAKRRIGKDARIWEWESTSLEVPLVGQTLSISMLDLTVTDVMVKIIIDEIEQVVLLKPESNSLIIGEELKKGKAISRYIRLGIEHIMLGIDHLLFVLGLLLLSRTRWLLIKTITSFTVGHSFSLALATLGFIVVPEKPLSAVIALSIVFLAWELIRSLRGYESITIRNPWIVSFLFGIIHGIGFAGGLVSLGLPQAEIPLALLFFNIGVEIGQLGFILLVITLMWSFRNFEFKLPRKIAYVPVYAIGSFACYWFLGRMIDIF